MKKVALTISAVTLVAILSFTIHYTKLYMDLLSTFSTEDDRAPTEELMHPEIFIIGLNDSSALAHKIGTDTLVSYDYDPHSHSRSSLQGVRGQKSR